MSVEPTPILVPAAASPWLASAAGPQVPGSMQGHFVPWGEKLLAGGGTRQQSWGLLAAQGG